MAADTKRPNLQTDTARSHSLHREVKPGHMPGSSE